MAAVRNLKSIRGVGGRVRRVMSLLANERVAKRFLTRRLYFITTKESNNEPTVILARVKWIETLNRSNDLLTFRPVGK